MNPFDYADIVTTTTHKTLRGPRAGLIFFKKIDASGQDNGIEQRINNAVFPSCPGGPHNNTIAGVAVALKQANTSEFVHYCRLVRKNCKSLAEYLISKKYTLVSGGTDNHLLLWDLKNQGVSGAKMEKLCELAHITINKNSVKGDLSAVTPGGVRIGTAALTTRGFKPEDMIVVGELLIEALELTIDIQNLSGSKLLKDFVAFAQNSEKVQSLKLKVQDFARKFAMPGYK